MMKLWLSASTFLVAVISAPVSAAPNKPLHAAHPESGSGCQVRGSEEQAHALDPECKFHLVTKADKDGNLVSLRYQDKGSLQAGQSAPATALKIEGTLTVGSLSCTSSEVITPSGNYSSVTSCK